MHSPENLNCLWSFSNNLARALLPGEVGCLRQESLASRVNFDGVDGGLV